jgi:hypothetical protein
METTAGLRAEVLVLRNEHGWDFGLPRPVLLAIPEKIRRLPCETYHRNDEEWQRRPEARADDM